MRRFKNICLILLSFLWVSCTDPVVYHSYHHFTQQGWNKNDTLHLGLLVTDSLPDIYEITFLVRNQSDYLYQNFDVRLYHNMPDSSSWKSYDLNFTLAGKDGRWTGSGWAGLYESVLSLGKVRIARPGAYTFKVVHLMQDEQLQGISDIGVLLRKESPGR